MPWRKITADQYRTMSDPEGFDEAFLVDPDSGWRREIWDCGEHLHKGQVVIYTALLDDILVDPDHPIFVR